MSKITKNSQMEKLNEIVSAYVQNNTECNALKKLVVSGSKEIKDIMTSLNIDDYDNGEYAVFLSHIDKSYMDAEKLLAFIKAEFPKELQKQVIKKREYVDDEALESILYKNEVSDEIVAAMSKCMVEKEEIRLNIKKAKEGKE